MRPGGVKCEDGLPFCPFGGQAHLIHLQLSFCGGLSHTASSAGSALSFNLKLFSA